MALLLAGTKVSVRGIICSVVSGESVNNIERYRLRCIEGGLTGEIIDILLPLEKISVLRSEFRPESASILPEFALYHQAFFIEHIPGMSSILASVPGRLKITPYQLVPLKRALEMSRVRLMLADAVGLGKTIEAGIILAELLARKRAHRILIVTPAGVLLEQWRLEMKERFGLNFFHINRESLQRLAYENEAGVNPFMNISLGIISIDFAKQESNLQLLENVFYDTVVIDEAHHCAKLGANGTGEDSRRRKAAEVFAKNSDTLLLATATPHDGYDQHFASLMELLDPSLVDSKGNLRGESYRRHIVRRLKSHIKDTVSGLPLFLEREIYPIGISVSGSNFGNYIQFQKSLISFIGPVLRKAFKQKRFEDVLSFLSLFKRSVSSVYACKNTLRVIVSRMQLTFDNYLDREKERKEKIRNLKDMNAKLEKFGALTYEEEEDKCILEAEGIADEIIYQSLSEDDIEAELKDLSRQSRAEKQSRNKIESLKQGLEDLLVLAEKSEKQDPKLHTLKKEIEGIRNSEPEASILIYTEYTDSQTAIFTFLNECKGIGEILQLNGGSDYDDETRKLITFRFTSETGLILISTDATAEGLNLHSHCHHLIHFELPYNPNRMEQRNGRIDRFGQKKKPQIRYLYLNGTFEEGLLIRLISKFENQRKALTFVPNTLGITMADYEKNTVRLLQGALENEESLFKESKNLFHFQEEDSEQLESKYYKEIVGELDKVFNSINKGRKDFQWIYEKGLHSDLDILKASSILIHNSGRLTLDFLTFIKNSLIFFNRKDSVKELENGDLEIKLPADWIPEKEDWVGLDKVKGIIRLTSNIDKYKDAEGNIYGFVGITHPLLRLCIEKVRSVQYRENEMMALDSRVSAVKYKGESPAVLYTFFCQYRLQTGSVFEKIYAVQTSIDGKFQFFENPSDWNVYLELGSALSTKDIWKKHFTGWSIALDDVKKKCLNEFASAVQKYRGALEDRNANERKELDLWLNSRAEDICGKTQNEEVHLFEKKESLKKNWKTVKDSETRLYEFLSDAEIPVKEKVEAKFCIDMYRKRKMELDQYFEKEDISVSELGMLMLIPESVC